MVELGDNTQGSWARRVLVVDHAAIASYQCLRDFEQSGGHRQDGIPFWPARLLC